MKLKFLFSFILMGTLTIMNAQSLEELKSLQSDKAAEAADHSAMAGAAQAEVDALQGQIEKLIGWRKGLVEFLDLTGTSQTDGLLTPTLTHHLQL